MSGTTRFIAVRVLTTIPTLVAVITLIFFVVRLAPGDPVVAALGEDASPRVVAELRHDLGLDRPLPVQYVRYLAGLARGEFGQSLVGRRPVLLQITAVFPYTLELTLAAVLLGVVLGVPAGVACALWRNSWIDYVGRAVSLTGLSVPAFFSAILLILIFALGTHWFPVITELDLSHPLDRLRNLVLPALSLGMLMTAYVSRATRSAMLEVLNEEYIVTARAKGVPQHAIVFRHALRNALIP
ncbi:MAG: ABC transporter permease, partial [Steroidobacteraceae bacterium]